MSDRYFFDQLPFEQDIFSHFFTRVAKANIEAEQIRAGDRSKIRTVLESMIGDELRAVLPSMDAVGLQTIASRLPAGLRHPAFGPAWMKIRAAASEPSGVLAVPAATEAAIVLAAMGIPAAILPRNAGPSICDPTLDLDQLIAVTAGRADYIVGFEPARTPYFYMVSASVRSLRRSLDSDPRFSLVRQIIPASTMPIPVKPTGTWGVHPKDAADRIPSVGHADNKGGELTTIFIGGWVENGVACDPGAPTVQPIPMRILEYIMRHGVFAMSLPHHKSRA